MMTDNRRHKQTSVVEVWPRGGRVGVPAMCSDTEGEEGGAIASEQRGVGLNACLSLSITHSFKLLF